MSHRICCYILFDITQTGVMNRSKPTENEVEDWIAKRNTQCNFDTLLQVISLRSQPEVVKLPTRHELTKENLDRFGFIYHNEDSKTSYCWKFEFEVQHSSVFENGIVPLGALYVDCEGVPMILCKDQLKNMPAFLNTTSELQNIYFEVS